jgi:SAM-dependent methyltransferase
MTARRTVLKRSKQPAARKARSAPAAAPGPRAAFDEGYFHRFYRGSEKERAHSAAQVATLAQGLDGLCAWLHVPVRAVLDVGAGPGFLRDWYRQHRPAVEYRSVDYSAYACAQYGHEQADISRLRDGLYDLIVCQGVLQYLDDAACARAVRNLAAMARGLVYLEIVTAKDLAEVCDPAGTDQHIHVRTGAYYRKLLRPHFLQVGAGLWAARDAGLVFYELEGAAG